MNDIEPSLISAKLRSILAAVREDLRPELATPQARLRAELIDLLLTRLAVETDADGAGGAYQAKLQQLLDAAAPAPAASEALRARALSDRLLAADLGDPVQRVQTAQLVAAVAALECKRRAEVEERVVAAARAQPGGKRSSNELAIAPAALTAYLRQRFPDDASIAADTLTTVPGGRSKGTIVVELSGAAGPRSIVLRRDFDASVTGTSVSYEYPIVRAAWRGGLPVPEPLWLEDDPAAIGGRFIAFSRVPGRAMGTLFASDATPAFVREFAAALARLHALDIDQAGLADQLYWGREAHPVRAMLASFRQRYRANVPATPLMDAAFAWLDLQIDGIGVERALVHGDAGLHNTMGDGERLTALLDWEFAHAGDPAEDLTYCKYLVERILPWDEFMAAYLAHGGRPVSEQRMRFFTVWRTLHLAILTGGAQTLFESGGDQDLRIAGIGYTTFPRQLRDLAANLAAYTGEVQP
ncbi:phosphotransferase family protein [Massilia cavernae]|uniref:Phosphotransferase family protein n=1 Tax=Massilia cavernae TaxID=2320864 RepID=A0A418X7E3_9BURK|nr:phosphotransferase family protein [Massilia cavernae]RJG08283.1 phosphotransferase family protein [Massilia cavernae]